MPGWLEAVLTQVATARVAVFGDFALDAYWELDGDESERSLETGKPVRKVRTQHYGLGGAGNIVANLAAAGVAEVRAIGMVGDDPFGAAVLAELARLGVDADGMLRSQADWQTAVFTKPHRHGIEEQRIDFGAFNEADAASLQELLRRVEAAAAECDIVVLNQQIPAGLTTVPVIRELNRIVACHPPGRFLVDSRDRAEEFTGAIIKLNAREAAAWHGPGTIEEVARALHQRTGLPLFVTEGAAGIHVAVDGKVTVEPGIPVSGPVDTVGAGDTAVAAIAAALAGGADAGTAARLANLAAAVTVSKLRRTGTATPDEIRGVAAP